MCVCVVDYVVFVAVVFWSLVVNLPSRELMYDRSTTIYENWKGNERSEGVQNSLQVFVLLFSSPLSPLGPCFFTMRVRAVAKCESLQPVSDSALRDYKE